jgi:hypothetical protein
MKKHLAAQKKHLLPLCAFLLPMAYARTPCIAMGVLSTPTATS